MNYGKIFSILCLLAVISFLAGSFPVAGKDALNIRDGLVCFTAANLLMPVGTVGNIAYFLPGIDDIVITIFITAIILAFVEKAFHKTSSGVEKLAFLFITWVSIKIISLSTVYSIPGCPAYAQTSNNFLAPLQTISLVVVPCLIIRFFLVKK